VKEGRTVFRLDAKTAGVNENPGFTRAMAALADLGEAPRTIRPGASSRAIGMQPDGTSSACLSDLFLALSDAMASAPMR